MRLEHAILLYNVRTRGGPDNEMPLLTTHSFDPSELIEEYLLRRLPLYNEIRKYQVPTLINYPPRPNLQIYYSPPVRPHPTVFTLPPHETIQRGYNNQ